jgi:hypothetical protein
MLLHETKFEFGHALTTGTSHLLKCWKEDNVMNYFFVLKSMPFEVILKNIMGVDSAIFAQLIQWSLIGKDVDFIFGIGRYASAIRLEEQSKSISICKPVVLYPLRSDSAIKDDTLFQYLLEYQDGTLLGQSRKGPKRGDKEFWVKLCLENCDSSFLQMYNNSSNWYLGSTYKA